MNAALRLLSLRERGDLMRSISRSICLVCLAYYAAAADAKLITKHLHDVSFADGGKAIGSLVFDTRSKGIVDFDITATSGNSIPSSFRCRSGTARITQRATMREWVGPSAFFRSTPRSMSLRAGVSSFWLSLVLSKPTSPCQFYTAMPLDKCHMNSKTKASIYTASV